MNNELRKKYDKFSLSIIEKDSMSQADKLCYAYHLELQDRIQEAIEVFSPIGISKTEDGSMVLQYDYMPVLFDFIQVLTKTIE